MKLDPAGGESPLRPPDWGALLNGQPSAAALGQMSLLMAEGVASSLCEAQLAEGGASPAGGSAAVFTGGEPDRRGCCHCSCGPSPRPEGNTFPNGERATPAGGIKLIPRTLSPPLSLPPSLSPQLRLSRDCECCPPGIAYVVYGTHDAVSYTPCMYAVCGLRQRKTSQVGCAANV